MWVKNYFNYESSFESQKFKEIGINSSNGIDSAKERDYWRDLVNAALNLRVP